MEKDGPAPLTVHVVPEGTTWPKAIVVALRKAFDTPAKDMKEIVAVILVFGSWRELVQAAMKNKAYPPEEEYDAAMAAIKARRRSV